MNACGQEMWENRDLNFWPSSRLSIFSHVLAIFADGSRNESKADLSKSCYIV